MAGALQELSKRDVLTPTTGREVLTEVLIATGTPRDSALAFQDRLDDAAGRDRFRQMMEAGQAGLAAALDQTALADDLLPENVMRAWSKLDASAGQRTLTLLLTDLVGSTAMTGKLGNAGAQRIVRAHNSIVRAALKNARGTEVKHTGDGILASFEKAVDAAAAATEIQQEIATLLKTSPDMPLAVRIGLHEGEIIIEGDDVYGDAIGAVDDVCAAVETGEIAASPAVQQNSAGGVFKYTPIAEKTIQIGGAPVALFKLVWEPKRAYGVAPLEYRQIGGKPLKS